jgi:carboxypeptidase C (cathepsin A)
MLFIDQPNQVGLGYDVLRNGTQDLTNPNGDVQISDFADGVPEQNATFLVGTYPSQLEWASVNGTENAARSLWHFAQVWFETFPNYKPNDDRISLWTESYGGHYGPAFVNFFREQNEKIANGTWTDAGETYEMHLDTLGIINGCIDSLEQELSYPQFAYNNTYGIQAINQSVYEQSLDAWSRAGGLKELIERCRTLGSESDPTNQGHNATVNEACAEANIATGDLENPYFDAGYGYYDIAAVSQDPFPRNFYVGYLNQPHVQRALGVPVNYTNPGGSAPYYAFQNTGDYPRGGFMQDIGQLVDAGVKVHLVYGDRDYACNWIGGEAVSLAVQFKQMEQFAAAGYTNVSVNSSYVGGLVRQQGNFSFTRVFQAGHEVPSYQPETAYEIFRRALFNLDIATGQVSTAQNASYSTAGLADTWSVKQAAPESEAAFCYSYALSGTCTDEQYQSVVDGSAVIQNYVVIDNYTSRLFPELAAAAAAAAASNGSNAGNGTSGGGSAGGSGSGSGGSGEGAAAAVRAGQVPLTVLAVMGLSFFLI